MVLQIAAVISLPWDLLVMGSASTSPAGGYADMHEEVVARRRRQGARSGRLEPVCMRPRCVGAPSPLCWPGRRRPSEPSRPSEPPATVTSGAGAGAACDACCKLHCSTHGWNVSAFLYTIKKGSQ